MVLIDGVLRHVQVAHMRLCASCAFWLEAYPPAAQAPV